MSRRGKQSVVAPASREQAAGGNGISFNKRNRASSVPDVMDGHESQKNKVKRLRTRKERNRCSGEVASKRKQHHHHHDHHHRNHMCSRDKLLSHCCSQTSSKCRQGNEARFARLFPSAQEPSVITTNRLIGHQGLFNHEVKSIDIERLLSEQRKEGRSCKPGLQENNLDAIHQVLHSHLSSPCSSGEANMANSIEGVLVARDSDAALHQEKGSHGSDITPGQRPHEKLLTTNSPGDSVKHNTVKEKTPTRGNENVRSELGMVNTQLNPTTSKIQPLTSKLAERLCHSLNLPLLRRRDMLAESREFLLLALRERHGPLLQKNLHRVQRRLSFGRHTVQGPDAISPSIESDGFCTAIQGKTFDPFCIKKASGKSLRKLKHTNWIAPPKIHQNLNQAVEDCLESVRPGSCPWFGLGHEPSTSTPPGHSLSFSPMPQWPEMDPLIRLWDKRCKSPSMRDFADMCCVESCSLNQATAVPLGSSETDMHSFLCYLPGKQGRHPADPRHHHGEHVPVEIATSLYSREEDYRPPFYHFKRRPMTPFPKPYHSDMIHYPPSDLLDRGQSTPLTSFNSPDGWSFPPMRLY